MWDFGWGHLLGMERTQKKKSLPCLTTHFSVASPISPFFICSKHIHLPNPPVQSCPLLPDSLVGWSSWWMNVDDPHCEEVMELSAVPFLCVSFTHCLLLLILAAVWAYKSPEQEYLVLTTCLLSNLHTCLKCGVEEKDRGRWQKELGLLKKGETVEGVEMSRDNLISVFIYSIFQRQKLIVELSDTVVAMTFWSSYLSYEYLYPI